MTRPSRPQVDQGEYVPYDDPDQLVVPAFREEVNLPDNERRKALSVANNIRHRTRNGYRDPLSVLLVLDMVQRWSPKFTIRTRYMVNELNKRRRSFMWDPTTVGKIMGELAEIGQEAYADRPDLWPLHQHEDGRGNLYFINSTPTTYRYLWKLRQQLQSKCQDIMVAEAEGREPRFQSAWDDIDTSPVF